jgi:oligosaccharide repeat unit polymerase
MFTYSGGLWLFFHNGAGVSYGGGEPNYQFYISITGGIFLLALGMISASIAFGFSPRQELIRFRNRRWSNAHGTPGDRVVIALFGIVAIVVSAFYIYSRGSLPIIKIILAQGSENVYELAYAARAEFSRYGRGAGSYFFQGYFQQFYLIVLPFVSVYVGAQYLHQRTAFLRWLWILCGTITVFVLAVSLQRWPTMFFIILNYILFASYAGRIKISHALMFVFLALSLFGFLTYIRGMEGFAMAVDWIWYRIYWTNVDVLYSLFELFPEHIDFFGGQAFISDIKGVMPGPDTGFARWLYDKVYQVYGNGTASTMMWGELYADFGLIGVLIGSLFIGFTMQSLYIFLIRGNKDTLSLLLYTIFTMALGQLGIANVSTVLIQYGMVTTLLLVTVLKATRWIFSPPPLVLSQSSLS